MNRNTWKLCREHQNCSKCKKCVDSWKNKSNKHASNAKALKYVLLCLMDDRTQSVSLNDDDEEEIKMNPLPKTELRGTSKWRKCGICLNKITYGGDHNMVVFPCGHTTCLGCYNNPHFLNKASCPYCRADIRKAYALWGDETEENEDE